MDNYGNTSRGITIIEIADTIPDWSISDRGRILFDNSTGYCWIGGNTIDSGENGWFIINLNDIPINNLNIYWNFDNNSINANSFPGLFHNNITNIQTMIDNILDNVIYLSTGELLLLNSIKHYHLDISCIDSKNILINNKNNLFPNTTKTIYDSLKVLSNRRLSNSAVQYYFEKNIELIKNLSAKLITYKNSTVQFFLDENYRLLKNLKLTNIFGLPNSFGIAGDFFMSNGIRELKHKTIYSEYVNCNFPNTINTNIQNGLIQIEKLISNVDNSIYNIGHTSEEISFIKNKNSKFNDVNFVLDWLFSNSFNSLNPPSAVNIKIKVCNNDSAINIQESFSTLQSQFKNFLSSIPCHFLSTNILYDSPVGHTNLQESIDYLFQYYFNNLKGSIGNTGGFGLCGLDGLPGLSGFPGSPGDVGLTGGIGMSGMIGPPGISGLVGNTGETGASGCKGPPGFSGNTGRTGDCGFPGLPGSTGGTGGTGDKGPPGSPGLDNYITGPIGGVGGSGAGGILIGVGPPGGPGGTGITGGVGGTGSSSSSCTIFPGGTGATGGIGGTGAACSNDDFPDSGVECGTYIAMVWMDETYYYTKNPVAGQTPAETYRSDLQLYGSIQQSAEKCIAAFQSPCLDVSGNIIPAGQQGTISSGTGINLCIEPSVGYPMNQNPIINIFMENLRRFDTDPQQYPQMKSRFDSLLNQFRSMQPTSITDPDYVFLQIDNTGSMNTSIVDASISQLRTYISTVCSSQIIETTFGTHRWLYNMANSIKADLCN